MGGMIWRRHCARVGAYRPLRGRTTIAPLFRNKEAPSMCDYSLHQVASRAAKLDDKLITTKFSNSSTHGFAAVGERHVAVCLLPGAEVAFDENVRCRPLFDIGFLPSKKSDSDSPASGRSIRTTPSLITMRWSFPTAKSCCLRVCARGSVRRYCSCPPPRTPR